MNDDELVRKQCKNSKCNGGFCKNKPVCHLVTTGRKHRKCRVHYCKKCLQEFGWQVFLGLAGWRKFTSRAKIICLPPNKGDEQK